MATIFTPFRSTGIVCNKQPASLQKLGNDNFLTCPVGNTFHVYNVHSNTINLTLKTQKP